MEEIRLSSIPEYFSQHVDEDSKCHEVHDKARWLAIFAK